MEPSFFTANTSTPADFTIVTGDNKEIPVHRIILSIASTVFNDMFSLPRSSDASDGHAKPHNKIIATTRESLGTGSERVEITENARTISLVLSLIYPTSFTFPPEIPLSVLSNALECAIKYDFEVAITKLNEILISRAKKNKQEALMVYAIGCALQQTIVVDGASRECLRVGFNQLLDLVMKETIQQPCEAEEARVTLQNMKALDLCRLLDFHRESQKFFVDILHDSWDRNGVPRNCICPSCCVWHDEPDFKQKLLDLLDKHGPSVHTLSINPEAQVICSRMSYGMEKALVSGNSLLQQLHQKINNLPGIESRSSPRGE